MTKMGNKWMALSRHKLTLSGLSSTMQWTLAMWMLQRRKLISMELSRDQQLLMTRRKM